MREIGGYFGLEISEGYKNHHSTPYKLKSGRASLAFILKQQSPSLVYIPYYTCNALLEPLENLGIPYQFYSINEYLEISFLPQLKYGELLIYINYFDIKREYAEFLSGRFREQVIIDCTQAYFLKGNSRSWYLNSSRKFFGVPDGSDLYVPDGVQLVAEYNALAVNNEYITEHLTARFKGETQYGYPFFQKNEVLSGHGIRKMSLMSANLLSNVDFKKACQARQRNFRYLHQQIGHLNTLIIKDPFTPAPGFYPFLPDKFIDKKIFWENNIFIPNFWNDCLERECSEAFLTEKNISRTLVPIPIDHRYLPADYSRLLSFLIS